MLDLVNRWAIDGVSREHVRQIEASALEHLRAPAIAQMLKDFTDADSDSDNTSWKDIEDNREQLVPTAPPA